MDFVSGEKIQCLAQLILGYDYDFVCNPFINQIEELKFMDFRHINEYDNPRIMFCYGNRLEELSLNIDKFKNPFILISHNSDYNISDNFYVRKILENTNLIKWFGQNVEYIHPKIHFLPIGIANRMWEHGNVDTFCNITLPDKMNDIYMNFRISTNEDARLLCLNTLSKIIDYQPITTVQDNFNTLKTYKFCICPDGNGIDSHRLWEALYFKTVPILLRSAFSENIKATTGLPMILLDKWEDLDIGTMPKYETFDFKNGDKYLRMSFYEELINMYDSDSSIFSS